MFRLASMRVLRLLFSALLLAAGLYGPVSAREQGFFARSPHSEASRVGVIHRDALPVQGRAMLARIWDGGPFRGEKDGIVFGNYERILPSKPRGYYREYTVPTPGARNRGARRIVCGGPKRHPDVCYYTNDHYASFRRIVD